MSLKPICKPCARFFRPHKNGFTFIEGKPDTNGAAPGTLQPWKWSPYKLWIGDLWKCQGCGTEIVVGVGSGPISEHYKDDFTYQVNLYNTKFQVNDC